MVICGWGLDQSGVALSSSQVVVFNQPVESVAQRVQNIVGTVEDQE